MSLDYDMKIPKKLTPDPVLDSMIVVHIELATPFVLFASRLFHSFKENLDFFQNNSGNNISITPQDKGFSAYFESNASFLANQEIKIQLTESKLVFNSNERYIGWDILSGYVQDVLKVVVEEELISKVSRVGLRFINQFEETDISSIVSSTTSYVPECIKIEGDTKFINHNLQFVDKNEQKVSLSLVSTKGERNVCSIDVDIIKENFASANTDSIYQIIETLHDTEKKIFFNIVDATFLEENYEVTY